MSPEFSNPDSEKLYKCIIEGKCSEESKKFPFKETKFGRLKNNEIVHFHGGEILLSVSCLGIEPANLGKAVAEIPTELKEQFNTALVNQQVEYVKSRVNSILEGNTETQSSEHDIHFSINLEHGIGMDGLRSVLGPFFEGELSGYSQYITFEIKEDGVFSVDELQYMREVAEESGISYALDDCCSENHDASQEKNYENLNNIIRILGPHLKYIKFDFNVMKDCRIEADFLTVFNAYNLINRNCEALSKIYKGNQLSCPSLIVESMPWNLDSEANMYQSFEKRAQEYGLCDIIYQYL